MCTTNIYTYVYPDGRKTSSHDTSSCTLASRTGQTCTNAVVFQHPTKQVQYSSSSSATQQFPPTLSYTPRSNTPNYRSGDESDRSYRSNSGSRQSSAMYFDGRKVVDVNSTSSRRRDQERIVVVEGPPTAGTPPKSSYSYNLSHTAPSSPNTNMTGSSLRPDDFSTSPRESNRRRPVIVDERSNNKNNKSGVPTVKIEITTPSASSRDSSKHSRHPSTSSHDSRGSRTSFSSVDYDEETFRRRRQQLHDEKRRVSDEQLLREQEILARIAHANAEIANRPSKPSPASSPQAPAPAAPAIKRSSTYIRPSVEVTATSGAREVELTDAVQRMSLGDERVAHREEKSRRKAEKGEDEAQKQRLRERMMPKRRASVGPGSRRERVFYDNGVYRYE